MYAAQAIPPIDAEIAEKGHLWTETSYNPASLVQDAKDLIDALGLKDFVIGGWSIGGIAMQIFMAMFGDSVSHLVLLSPPPPGKLVKPAPQFFFDTAAQPGINLEQFTTIFFEPKDEGSRAASKRSFDRIFARKSDRSPEVPADWAIAQIGTTPQNQVLPSEEVLHVLKTTTVPILHIVADHDIIFPIENRCALNNQLPT